MKSHPLFSIITVCFNASRTIKATLDSIAEQSCDDYEVIIVDGASTDGTLDILHSYSYLISSLTSEPDKGIYDAMNKGILKATGDYLLFLNADDKFYNKYVLETVSKLIEKNPGHKMIFGDAWRVDNKTAEYYVCTDVHYCNICHQSIFYARSLFEETGLYDTRYFIIADWDLNMNYMVSRQGSCLHINRPLCTFRMGGVSGSRTMAEKAQSDLKLMREKWGIHLDKPNLNKVNVKEVSLGAHFDEAFHKKYIKLNNSFEQTLVYKIGDSAGLFSEINCMILALLYCLDKKIKFVLYSDGANFSRKGWEDFFLPFVEETHDEFHMHNNRRYISTIKNYNHAFVTKYIRNHRIDYLTSDVFPRFFENIEFATQCFDIPSLNISGHALDTISDLASMVVRLNEKTSCEVEELIFSLNLPEQYIALQIRGGDIVNECEWRGQELLSIVPYIEKIDALDLGISNVFVFTDDYRHVEALRQIRPAWSIYTLCGEKENGFTYDDFDLLTDERKRCGIIKILANTEICRRAATFIGTRVSNPSWFLHSVMPRQRCHFVDTDKLEFDVIRRHQQLCQRQQEKELPPPYVNLNYAYKTYFLGIKIIRIMVEQRGARSKKRVQLFNHIPLLKILESPMKMKWLLFNCIPIFKVRRTQRFFKYYFFGVCILRSKLP